MKYFIIQLIFFLSACTTINSNSGSNSLNFENVVNFKPGLDNEKTVLKLLGAASRRDEKGSYYTLSYNEPSTGLHRLSMNFSSDNNQLLSVLWIPKENEKEFSIENAKTSFKEAHFKEIRDNNKNPHITMEVISYIDEQAGISIRYNQSRNIVEAIAKYSATKRIPADLTSDSKDPYSY